MATLLRHLARLAVGVLLLSGCAPRPQALVAPRPLATPEPIPTTKLGPRSSYRPIEAERFTVERRGGVVEIQSGGGAEPLFGPVQVLATVLLDDRTSNLFHVRSDRSYGSSSVYEEISYNRRAHTLEVRRGGVTAGYKPSEEPRDLCGAATDEVILRTIANPFNRRLNFAAEAGCHEAP